MQTPHQCPECSGSGCSAKPLQVPDGSTFLFPRCEVCKGSGALSAEQFAAYLKREERG